MLLDINGHLWEASGELEDCMVCTFRVLIAYLHLDGLRLNVVLLLAGLQILMCALLLFSPSGLQTRRCLGPGDCKTYQKSCSVWGVDIGMLPADPEPANAKAPGTFPQAWGCELPLGQGQGGKQQMAWTHSRITLPEPSSLQREVQV